MDDLDHLLAAVFERYGYDFRRYARSSIHRRLAQLSARAGVDSIAGLEAWVLGDRAALQMLIDAVTVRVTEMFRDPGFYADFVRDVVPLLRSYPTLKLWIAGCSTGEEAHSLAILLHEQGLAARARVYATDLNPGALARARDAIYTTEQLKGYAENHRRAGGTGSFASYFTIAHGHAALAPELTRNVHYAEHNLVSDEVFGEMNVIFCRNVLIYFDRGLQEHALALLSRSLMRGGVLCLGSKESLSHSSHANGFEELAQGSRIFRKKSRTGELG